MSLLDDVAPWDEVEVSEPEMAAPGGSPSSREALDAALASGPVMAGDWWDTELQLVEPTLFTVEGARPLLYPGMSHVIIGEPGRGKSMLGQYLLVQEAAAGRCCLFIDLEKNFSAFRERIRALGATRETAGRIGYWRLNRGLSPKAVERIIEFATRWGVQVVVVDSVGRALSRAGLDENNNDDVRRWYDGAVEPMMRATLTVLMVDHFKKPQGDGGRPGGSPSAAGRYAKGAGAKLDTVTGAAYGVEFVTPFSRTQPGMAKIVVAKDNNGARAEGEVAAEVRVVPHDDGRRIEMTLVAPEPLPTNPDGSARYTVIMESVSRFVQGAAGPQSRAQVEGGVAGNARRIRSAVDRLIAEGYLTETAGPRNSRMLAHVRPYRQDEDRAAAGPSGRAVSVPGRSLGDDEEF